MALTIGVNSYISVAQADDHFEFVIQETKQWAEQDSTTKEKYIVSAFREISEISFASIDKAEREQLRLLEMLFLDYDEFMKRKHLRMSGVKQFKNKEWEEKFDTSDRAGDGSFGFDNTTHGNAVIDL